MTGAQGTQGTIGTSVTGAQGTQGTIGTSVTGAQGTQGTIGTSVTGAQGTQGTIGTSVTGSQGTQGTIGTSVTGAQGTQGTIGTSVTGAQGTIGTSVTGAQGTSGATILGNSNTWTGTNTFYSNAIGVNRINFRTTGGSSSSDPYCLRFVENASNDCWLELQLNDDSNEEFRIYGNSCVGYGCGDISGNLYHRFRADGYAWHAGDLVAAGNVTAYSDLKLKDNIITIDGAVNKVQQLRGVYYTKKSDITKARKIGVIAQEIKQILPEVVLDNVDIETKESILSVDYGNITALLIEAIKEQQSQIEELKLLVQSIAHK